MKEYNIPIIWESYKTYSVNANSLEEAITEALKLFLKEPDENYLDDSFQIDEIINDDYPDEDFDIHKILNKI